MFEFVVNQDVWKDINFKFGVWMIENTLLNIVNCILKTNLLNVYKQTWLTDNIHTVSFIMLVLLNYSNTTSHFM